MKLKNTLTTVFLFVFCSIFGQNYPNQSDLLWVTTPDNSNWLYQLNEEAEIEVCLYRYGILLNDIDINYSIGSELMPDDTQGAVKLKNGKAIVSMGTMSEP